MDTSLEPLFTFKFEIDPSADVEELAQQIQSRLETHHQISDCAVDTDSRRMIGLGDLAAIITADIAVVSPMRIEVEELTQFLSSIKALAAELRGINAIRVSARGEPNDIAELPESRLRRVAAALAVERRN
jgi:hypothetical protein